MKKQTFHKLLTVILILLVIIVLYLIIHVINEKLATHHELNLNWTEELYE